MEPPVVGRKRWGWKMGPRHIGLSFASLPVYRFSALVGVSVSTIRINSRPVRFFHSPHPYWFYHLINFPLFTYFIILAQLRGLTCITSITGRARLTGATWLNRLSLTNLLIWSSYSH